MNDEQDYCVGIDAQEQSILEKMTMLTNSIGTSIDHIFGQLDKLKDIIQPTTNRFPQKSEQEPIKPIQSLQELIEELNNFDKLLCDYHFQMGIILNKLK